MLRYERISILEHVRKRFLRVRDVRFSTWHFWVLVSMHSGVIYTKSASRSDSASVFTQKSPRLRSIFKPINGALRWGHARIKDFWSRLMPVSWRTMRTWFVTYHTSSLSSTERSWYYCETSFRRKAVSILCSSQRVFHSEGTRKRDSIYAGRIPARRAPKGICRTLLPLLLDKVE